jgi:hypothetical protein
VGSFFGSYAEFRNDFAAQLGYIPPFMGETFRRMNEFIVHARPIYIQAIERWIGKPVIKILTGMRRVGKSMLILEAEPKFRSSTSSWGRLDHEFHESPRI